VTFGQNTGTRTTKATMSGGTLELMLKNAFGDRVSNHDAEAFTFR
jgi:hypothetical protein